MMTRDNPYAPYDANYRRMLQSDITSAARALELDKKSYQEIREIMHQHRQFDAFASKVIIEACWRELDARWTLRGTED